MELQPWELKELIKSIIRETLSILLDMNLVADKLETAAKPEPDSYQAVVKKGNELVVERDVEDLYASGVREVQCMKGCIVTPLAKDKARELGISLVFVEEKGAGK